MLLELNTQKTKLCTHPALRSTGPDLWRCLLCGAEPTAQDLIDQRNKRRREEAIRRHLQDDPAACWNDLEEGELPTK